MKLIDILSEATFETYFMQVIIKIDKQVVNNTEVYNQVRGIKDVIVIKIVSSEKLEAMSDDKYAYELLEIKFINEGTPQETIKMIKENALKITGLVKFFPREKSVLKIRNY